MLCNGRGDAPCASSRGLNPEYSASNWRTVDDPAFGAYDRSVRTIQLEVSGTWPRVLAADAHLRTRVSSRDFDSLANGRSGSHTVRNASVGERRAARMDGYRPATAPMISAAPTPP